MDITVVYKTKIKEPGREVSASDYINIKTKENLICSAYNILYDHDAKQQIHKTVLG